MHVLDSIKDRHCDVSISRSVPFESHWLLCPSARSQSGLWKIAIRHRVCDSDCDTRAQRGRVAADTPEQILFVDEFLPHFVSVQFPRVFPFKSVLLSYNMLCTIYLAIIFSSVGVY